VKISADSASPALTAASVTIAPAPAVTHRAGEPGHAEAARGPGAGDEARGRARGVREALAREMDHHRIDGAQREACEQGRQLDRADTKERRSGQERRAGSARERQEARAQLARHDQHADPAQQEPEPERADAALSPPRVHPEQPGRPGHGEDRDGSLDTHVREPDTSE
jgi:hypothetical protein